MGTSDTPGKDYLHRTYKMQKQLGSGSYGKVIKCFARDTKETVALKVIPKKYAWYGKNEVRAHRLLQRTDRHHDNFVKLNRYFFTDRTMVLEFELLELGIDFMLRMRKPLRLFEIQQITQQLLIALKSLKTIGVVHGDIKPDNIMIVDRKHKPLKVKLIDFGLAFSARVVTTGHKIQNLIYRAPEVILGHPLTEAVDMWSLGCVVAYMYLGFHLYSARCEFDRVRDMVQQMQGQPDEKLLNSAVFTHRFFSFNKHSLSWRIKESCDCHPNTQLTDDNTMVITTDDILTARPNTSENEDTKIFVKLLKQMLEVDQKKRITPQEALLHPFFRLEHFPSDRGSTVHGKTSTSTSDDSTANKTKKLQTEEESLETFSFEEKPKSESSIFCCACKIFSRLFRL